MDPLPQPPTLSRRERKKLEVRAELASQAIALFGERGYNNVSVEDITEAANVSRTTFFRYYPTKEDVLVQWMRDIGDEAARGLEARPADEAPLTALRLAIGQLADLYAQDEDRSTLIERLRQESPAVQTAYRDKLAYWEDALTAALARRSGLDAETSLYPRITARVSMAIISSVSDNWLRTGQAEPVAAALDRAFFVIDEKALHDVLERDRAAAARKKDGEQSPDA